MKKLFSDTDVQQLVGQVLRYGVLTACFLAIAGGAVYLLHHGGAPVPSYREFQGEGAGYTTFEGIIKGAIALNPTEIIQFGVLALIATPILRVVLSLVAFILEKDKMYIVITLIVLGIIMTSIFGGLKV